MHEVKKKFARELRKAQTFSEEKVWELLRGRRLLGLKFRRQYVIEGFVVDFYCPEYKLVIEVDGGIHEQKKDYDRLRQEVIESKSNIVIRVKNKDIQNDCCALIRKINGVVRHKHDSAPNSIPSPFGRGGSVRASG